MVIDFPINCFGNVIELVVFLYVVGVVFVFLCGGYEGVWGY